MKAFVMSAILTLAILLPATAGATVWHVERDGSGDFTVIQDAVDVAESGDTIVIGPGRYDEYQTVHYGGIAYRDNYVYFEDKDLTFVGAGPDQTIIGPTDPNENEYQAFGIAAYNGTMDLRVQGIHFENINSRGVYLDRGHLEIENCLFTDSYMGVWCHVPDGGFIRDCKFENLADYGVNVYEPSYGMLIENCELSYTYGGVRYDWPDATDGIVRNCTFNGGRNGMTFGSGATGSIYGCTFIDQEYHGLVADLFSHVTAYDNYFNQTGGYGLVFRACDYLDFHDNVIESDWGCVFVAGPADRAPSFATTISCVALRPGSSVRVSYYPDSPVHLDMRYNYWGTTDLDEIAEWIYDGYDQEDVNIYIDYEPVADGPVPTEERSWSGVKALFRD